MPKIQYEQKNFSAPTLGIIGAAARIITEYQDQGFSLTLRQLYYQFVARGFIANTERDYKRIGSIVSDARRAGLIDWYAIEDRTRFIRKLSLITTIGGEMEFKDIIVELKDRLAKVTLNRPEALNALTLGMREELATAFEGFATDERVRAVLITGAGKAFCAGGDIKMWGDMTNESVFKAIISLVRRAVLAISSLPKPVIAMVNGDAVGGGCNLALACDIVIASEGARFGETFIRLGLAPDWGGTYSLPRLVGIAKSKELLLTGKLIGAKEAEQIGLINLAVPPEKLEETAVDMARQLAHGPTRAMGIIKKLINQAWLMDLPSALEEEARAQWELVNTEDFKEGKEAFLEKRKPIFKGR